MGYQRSSCLEKSSLSIQPGGLDAEVTLMTLSSFTSTRSAWEQPSIPCAVVRTNFLERSTPEINAFSDRMERAEDFLFTSWVFTPETQPQSGQEKRQVPFLNQGFVVLAVPAMAWEQDALHTQGSNSQTDVTLSKRAAKIPWPSRLLLLAGQSFQLHFIIE